MKFVGIICAAAIMFGAFGDRVGTGWSAMAGEDSTGAAITVTESQHDETVSLKVGDRLVVKLPAQMGTGYGWQRAGEDSDVLAFVGSKVIEAPGATPGRRELQAFTFRARKKGAASLEFQYRRPWEKSAPSDKIFRIKVTVAGG